VCVDGDDQRPRITMPSWDRAPACLAAGWGTR